jgi:signal recognition particle GTPase
MCRTILIEIPQDDDDEDSDYDSDEDEDDDDEEEENNESGDNNIEEITERFLRLGYTSLDIMSMLTGRYKRSDPKNTKENIDKMIKDFEAIIDDVDKEEEEREAMGKNDITLTLNI